MTIIDPLGNKLRDFNNLCNVARRNTKLAYCREKLFVSLFKIELFNLYIGDCLIIFLGLLLGLFKLCFKCTKTLRYTYKLLIKAFFLVKLT